MLFNSYTFGLFLAATLLVYWSLRGWTARKCVLLLASYFFYAVWNPPFVALLWISTVVDWVAARRIDRAPSPAARRAWLLTSLATNLGLLGFFKYRTFLAANFAAVAGRLGIAYQPPAFDFVLPVGISFYTFQTLSYTIDVYRGRLRPAQSFLDFSLYVTFFPQLVAGPIVRAVEFLPQCESARSVTSRQLGWGLTLLVFGLFQKVVLADSILAPVADQVYGDLMPVTTMTSWCGTLAFAGQILCDFSGYSTCAIGAAMCFGFALPDNFRCPYAAAGFSDFWRRWHITLSSWLRDYLYIPLGGNRRGAARTQVNLLVTMLLGGLWHGASWTYVAWGGLHGLYLVGERQVRAWWGDEPLGRRSPLRFATCLLTFVLVTLTWVFFRAKGFRQAHVMLSAMFGHPPRVPPAAIANIDWPGISLSMGILAAILAFQFALRDSSLEAAAARLPWWLRSLALAAMIAAIACTPGDDRAFIYFQF